MGKDNTSASGKWRKGDKVPVPPEGSIALLALGYRGLQLWRAKRREVTVSTNTGKVHGEKKG